MASPAAPGGDVRFLLEQAPGHLIRRAHQVSVAVFSEAMSGFGVTPVQFAILNALIGVAGIDQISLAQRVSFDAATIGSVIGRLETKGWIHRQPAPGDRRRKLLRLTPEGELAVAGMKAQVEAVQQRILEPLDVTEQQHLLGLLAKLVANHPRGTAT